MYKLLLSVFLFVLVACEEPIKSNVPTDMRFRLEEYLISDPYTKLNIPGEFFSVERNNHNVVIGYAGLILGQSLWGGFFAYDMACQVEASRQIKVKVVDDEELGQKVGLCEKCGTRYLLNTNGVPVGVKDVPSLVRYSIVVTGDRVVVSN